jgi:hypothetical protein
MDLAAPLWSDRNSVQGHVSSYYVKINEVWFVWAVPSLVQARTYSMIEEQPVSTIPRGADSNPARVKAQEAWHDWRIFIFKYSNTTELH